MRSLFYSQSDFPVSYFLDFNVPSTGQFVTTLKTHPSIYLPNTAQGLLFHVKIEFPVHSKSTWCLTSTETTRLIRDGEKVERGSGGGGETDDWRLYSYRYTVTTRMIPAIKMGSDESYFKVSLIVCRANSQDSVHRPQL